MSDETKDVYSGGWVVYKAADVGYQAVSLHKSTVTAVKCLPIAGNDGIFYGIAWWPWGTDLQDAISAWIARDEENRKEPDDG